MADLDDFFAKKDRKKAKGKKFTTTEEIAKKLEETGKRVDKPRAKEKSLNPEGGEETQQIEEEDEWREFEEEKKDYTGLKIGNLTVNENNDIESDDERGGGDNSSDGESREGGKHSGPWKKKDSSQQGEQQSQPKEGETESNSNQTNTSAPTGNYVARPLRNKVEMKPSRSKKSAPDINSEEYFPTLNSKLPQGNEATGPWGRRKRDEGTFEEVRNKGGNRAASQYSLQESQAQTPKLSLGNKYGALSQDQS